MSKYFIGVDVGSASVRAGIFDQQGNMLGVETRPIKQRNPQTLFIEQSSEDIWGQTCDAVKTLVQQSKVSPSEIKSIGFDATCSLVALDSLDKPVAISPDNDAYWNIIMWMDHRAEQETLEINQSHSEVLRYVGGQINVEMEIPKILWLKRNLPDSYKRIKKYFDLADFLQYKACRSEIRSSCTVTCKWTFLAHENRWDNKFFKKFGLEELLEDQRIGTQIHSPGTKAGTLTSETAQAMGLTTDTIVAVGLIDAHAGVLGATGISIQNTMTIIAGTSACHMVNNSDPLFVKGIWGPYYNAIFENFWLNEGGQSSAGSLIDFVIKDHIHYQKLLEKHTHDEIYTLLNKEVVDLRNNNKYLNADLHILGYHHGNRSPRSDSTLKGIVIGATLEDSLSSLAQFYLAAIQSVCYGTKHIIEECLSAGYTIDKIVLCGGATKNDLWIQELADITGYTIKIPKASEAVLLGSAILGAVASDSFSSISSAAQQMSHIEYQCTPNVDTLEFHKQKYKVFFELYQDFMKYRSIMQEFL